MVEDRSLETCQTEIQKKITEQNIQELQEISSCNIHIVVILEGEDREKRAEENI